QRTHAGGGSLTAERDLAAWRLARLKVHRGLWVSHPRRPQMQAHEPQARRLVASSSGTWPHALTALLASSAPTKAARRQPAEPAGRARQIGERAAADCEVPHGPFKQRDMPA